MANGIRKSISLNFSLEDTPGNHPFPMVTVCTLVLMLRSHWDYPFLSSWEFFLFLFLTFPEFESLLPRNGLQFFLFFGLHPYLGDHTHQWFHLFWPSESPQRSPIESPCSRQQCLSSTAGAKLSS